MSACGELCGTARWFGVAGTCNETTGLCECPDGYSGLDDWSVANDCHVPELPQTILWIAQLLMHMLCFVLCSYGLVYLCRHWNFVGEIRPVSLKRRISRVSVGQSSGGSQPSRSFFRKPRGSHHSGVSGAMEQQEWKRQRDTLFALALLVVYVASGIGYVLPFLLGIYRFEHNWYQDLGVAVAAPAILVGLWAVCYIWYRTLPSLRLYGQLFNIRSVLIRYPNLVRSVTAVNGTLILTASIGLLFVVPRLTEDEEVRKRCSQAFLVVGLGFLVNFFIFFTALLLFLRSIFYQLIRLSESTNTALDNSSINSSITAVTIMLAADVVFAPVAAGLFAVMAFTELGRNNMWLFINTVAIIGDFAAIVAFYVLVRKLAGPRVRARSGWDETSFASSAGSRRKDTLEAPPSPVFGTLAAPAE